MTYFTGNNLLVKCNAFSLSYRLLFFFKERMQTYEIIMLSVFVSSPYNI
jgi:hypothetical protein